MFGTVVKVDVTNKSASLQVAGIPDLVHAAFVEIKNAVPQSLEIAEVVSCDIHRRTDGGLRAARIEVLFGQSELDAIRQMTPSASWEQGQRRARAAGKARRKGERQ